MQSKLVPFMSAWFAWRIPFTRSFLKLPNQLSSPPISQQQIEHEQPTLNRPPNKTTTPLLGLSFSRCVRPRIYEGSRGSCRLRLSTRAPGVGRFQSRRATPPSAVAHLAGNCTACGARRARRAYRHEGLEFGQAQDVSPTEDSEQHCDHDNGHSRSLVRRRQQRSDHRCAGDDEDRVLAKHRSRALRFVGKSRGSPPAAPALDDSRPGPRPLPCSAFRRQRASAVADY